MRVALADAGDVDRLGPHRLGPVGGGNDECRRAVGHQGAVHGVERGGDPPVVHDVLDRDNVAQHRVPLEGRVLGLGRHDGRQSLLGHVVLVHVALGQQAVTADGGQAVGRLVGAVAHLAGHGDHPRRADARAGVVPADAQDGLRQAGVDRKSRLDGHERRGRAADGDRGEVAGLHAQVVREGRRVHQRQLNEGEGGHHPIHVGQRDPGIVERDLGDLGEELERAPSLELALLGLADSGDHDPRAQHSPRFAQVGRALAHPSSSWSSIRTNRGRRRPTAARRPEATQGRGQAGWPARVGTLPAARGGRQDCPVDNLALQSGFFQSLSTRGAAHRLTGPATMALGTIASLSSRATRRRSRCLPPTQTMTRPRTSTARSTKATTTPRR